MRRFVIMLLGCLCLAAQNLPYAEADDGNAGQVDVKGKQGKYEGRMNVSMKRSTRGKAPSRELTTVRPQANSKPHKLTNRELAAMEAMCRKAPAGICDAIPADWSLSEPSTAKLVGTLSSTARTLIVKLQLPDPTPRFGPDPLMNEWKMAAVGYPLWLWTDGPTVVSSRVRSYGVTFTLRADWQSTTFDMGDGHQVTCTSTAVYPTSTKPGRKSPACGYTYLTSSLPKGNYTVTATTNWRISWSALGQSGSVPGSHSGTWSLPVGELNALVVK